MDFILSDTEMRVLGCLIEKEMATPEYYPLSLNALTNACNQKSNRSPVVSYDENTVMAALNSLAQKKLARETHAAGSRVTKYLHELHSQFDLSRPELAVLCELLVRGPQTPGELRSNAGRMSPFQGLDEVDETLRTLMEHDPPFAVRLQREPGRKEARYAQLFGGEPSPAPYETAASPEATPGDRIAKLEEELASVREELDQLRQAFAEFKAQFS